MTEKTIHELEPTLSSLVKNILLKYYTPAFIIIDDKETIIHVHGKTSKFLELAPGEVRLNFMEMIRAELKSKLKTAIHTVFLQQKELILYKLKLTEDDEIKYVNIKIRPLGELGSIGQKLLLIIIEEIASSSFIPALVHQNHKLNSIQHKEIVELEQELNNTKSSLQTTIEELETTNEELKSSNEELQSTNEELQSLNEELATVNAELENRIEQLSSANDDIKNLLDNTEIATIFLDKNLCIKRFTPKAAEIVHVIPSDIGRPVGHIVSNLQYEKLIEDARIVLRNYKPITTETVDKAGHWYVVRIIPYRTIENQVDGVTITFLNIHAQKKNEFQLICFKKEQVALEETKQSLLALIADAAIILRANYEEIDIANDQFLKKCNLQKEDIVGKSIYKLNIAWDTNELEQIITQATKEKSSLYDAKLTINSTLTTISIQSLPDSTLLLTLR